VKIPVTISDEGSSLVPLDSSEKDEERRYMNTKSSMHVKNNVNGETRSRGSWSERNDQSVPVE
jgi:hypothetical protein